MKSIVLLLLLLLPQLARAQSIPAVHATSFAGAPVNLPADLAGKTGILVTGFSKKSSEQSKGWNALIMRELAGDPKIVYYQAPMLADVPGFVRGMVIRSIRSDTSDADRHHFFVITQDGPAWKRAAQYTGGDDAFVLVLDNTGAIKWRFHGPATPAAYQELTKAIQQH